MGARQSDRLWMIAGVAAVALMVVATWFLAVSTQRTDAAGLRTQTSEADAKATDLRNRIAKLTAQKAKLPALKEALNARRAALPSDSGVPAFLRQLQATGTKVGVDVSGIVVGDPEPEEAAPGVWSLPIQLTAVGTEAHLSGFLRQLQGTAQKRAVLIELASLSKDATDGVTLNITARAFVAPAVGGSAPTITTD